MWTTFLALVIVGVALTPRAFEVRAVDSRENQKPLHITTNIIRERYCAGAGTTFLEWVLQLRYTNRGERPVLVDKNSARISQTLVSRDEESAAAGRYIYKPIPVHADLDALGYKATPDFESFIILKPGESFTLEGHCRVSIYDGTSETDDDLRPGNYVLQVTVAAWRYYADAQQYRDKWRERGYLWSENVTSKPMPITIQHQPRPVPCSN